MSLLVRPRDKLQTNKELNKLMPSPVPIAKGDFTNRGVL